MADAEVELCVLNEGISHPPPSHGVCWAARTDCHPQPISFRLGCVYVNPFARRGGGAGTIHIELPLRSWWEAPSVAASLCAIPGCS